MNLLPLNPAQRQFALLLPTLALAGSSALQIDVDVYYVETSAAIQSVRTSENPNSRANPARPVTVRAGVNSLQNE